jgi:tetrahydromethanopterin S-methyltransferase subunit C
LNFWKYCFLGFGVLLVIANLYIGFTEGSWVDYVLAIIVSAQIGQLWGMWHYEHKA